MSSLLCETVAGHSMAELLAGREAVAAADMVELRLDGIADVDVAGALGGRRRPAIVTCRPVWEGGQFEGSEDERRRLLVDALACGAEYVDIEWRAVREDSGLGGFGDLVSAHPSRVVVSTHDFAGVPADVGAEARAMRATGAAVIKVAVTARRLSDTLPLLAIAAGGDAVVIGMGDAGMPSRLLASRFGSRWTYAGAGIAPGQVPASEMVDGFRFRSIGAGTALYGVAGAGAILSPLPGRFNRAFEAAGVDAVCVPLGSSDADDVRTFTSALGFAGVVEEPAAADQIARLLLEWAGQRVS